METTTKQHVRDSVTPFGKLCQKIADYNSALIVLKRLERYAKPSDHEYQQTITRSQIEGELKRLNQLKTDWNFGFISRAELEKAI